MLLGGEFDESKALDLIRSYGMNFTYIRISNDGLKLVVSNCLDSITKSDLDGHFYEMFDMNPINSLFTSDSSTYYRYLIKAQSESDFIIYNRLNGDDFSFDDSKIGNKLFDYEGLTRKGSKISKRISSKHNKMWKKNEYSHISLTKSLKEIEGSANYAEIRLNLDRSVTVDISMINGWKHTYYYPNDTLGKYLFKKDMTEISKRLDFIVYNNSIMHHST